MSVEIADPNHFELKNIAMAHISSKRRGGRDASMNRGAPYRLHTPLQYHIPQPPRAACYIFEVSNLPMYAAVYHLYNTFFSYGYILAVDIDPVRTSSGVICSGTGSVSLFATPDYAERALADLNGATVFDPLHPIGVSVSCCGLLVYLVGIYIL